MFASHRPQAIPKPRPVFKRPSQYWCFPGSGAVAVHVALYLSTSCWTLDLLRPVASAIFRYDIPDRCKPASAFDRSAAASSAA